MDSLERRYISGLFAKKANTVDNLGDNKHLFQKKVLQWVAVGSMLLEVGNRG